MITVSAWMYWEIRRWLAIHDPEFLRAFEEAIE